MDQIYLQEMVFKAFRNRKQSGFEIGINVRCQTVSQVERPKIHSSSNSVILPLGMIIAVTAVLNANVIPQFKYMNFIYSLHNFSLYGYITNSPHDLLPVGLITQLVRALHRYRRSHGFKSRSSPNFFRLYLLNCSSWVHNCDDLSFAKNVIPHFKEISHNSTNCCYRGSKNTGRLC